MAKQSKQVEPTRMPGEAEGKAAQQKQQGASTKLGVKKREIGSCKKEAGGQDRTSKIDQLVALLRRQKGVTVSNLAETLGWQQHSVRGAMSGALKKRGLSVVSEKTKGQRFYRLAG